MEYIYVFVNPESGGKRASAFVEPGVEEIKFIKPVPHVVKIFSLFDGESGNKPGFIELAELVKLSGDDKEKKVRVIIAGGDGSVSWVVTEVEKHSIDTDKIVFGIFPYGTGNDFARAFKWNKFANIIPFRKNLMPLRKAILKVFDSNIVLHDFWSVTIYVEPEGSFNKINPKTRKKINILNDNGEEVKCMEFMMGNYFSIGVESRIGRGFDRRRAKTPSLNKFKYLMESVKRTFFGKVHVERQIDKMLTGELFTDIIFVTEPNDDNIPILPKTASFIATNIPSFCSGLDCFKFTKKIGINGMSKDEIYKLLHKHQKVGDGRLEFVTYKKLPHIAFDFICPGRSCRVHEGEGPWKIIFKQLTPNEKTYFQVDGEFYVMLQPKEVVIRHMKRINVLA